MSVLISFRLSEELARKLGEIVAKTRRPRSFHIHKAIEAYVGELADLQIAFDRLCDQSDSVVSGRDLRKTLGL